MSVTIDYGPHKGQLVEIVKRNGKSARVRLPDGALLWVKTAGLVRETFFCAGKPLNRSQQS